MKTIETLPRQQTRKSTPAKSRKPLPSWQILTGGSGYLPARRTSARVAAEAPREETLLTTIAADINVGLGNLLFIRGEGEGLSWDQGVPLHCSGDSTWIWASTDVQDRVVFKFLLNDVIWAQGENLIVESGKDIRVKPVF
jgi:hypothetical protein